MMARPYPSLGRLSLREKSMTALIRRSSMHASKSCGHRAARQCKVAEGGMCNQHIETLPSPLPLNSLPAHHSFPSLQPQPQPQPSPPRLPHRAPVTHPHPSSFPDPLHIISLEETSWHESRGSSKFYKWLICIIVSRRSAENISQFCDTTKHSVAHQSDLDGKSQRSLHRLPSPFFKNTSSIAIDTCTIKILLKR